MLNLCCNQSEYCLEHSIIGTALGMISCVTELVLDRQCSVTWGMFEDNLGTDLGVLHLLVE